MKIKDTKGMNMKDQVSITKLKTNYTRATHCYIRDTQKSWKILYAMSN
jgi:hypothetical protein